jgi:hypothetical protein
VTPADQVTKLATPQTIAAEAGLLQRSQGIEVVDAGGTDTDGGVDRLGRTRRDLRSGRRRSVGRKGVGGSG